MLIVSLFIHIQYCVGRYKTRKALVLLTTQQMLDIGMTKDRQRAELLQASLYGFFRDLTNKMKKSE
ncbi:hypothetical protein [Marinomonas colpomeniae]|uniref:Uncharacterized protein n=1 Tax=Marinomonas colpomeniae TaxID=2774408 RepID=A0ABR8NY29_9GAMM|nr:hypothetical protein [Marinomonas colpomeniae]MBD5770118.1 hypothetical protein [Marinomonas colpomeniae]